MSCVAEAIENVRLETTSAEAKYRELVEAVAGGETKLGQDAVAVIGGLGKTLDQFRLDCEDAAASVADRLVAAEATRLTGHELCMAQREVARADSILGTINSAAAAISMALVVTMKREFLRVTDYQARVRSEISVLESFPNRKRLAGHRAGIERRAEEIRHAWKYLPERDNRDFAGRKKEIQQWEADLAELRTKPVEFSATAVNLPPVPEPADLYQVVLDTIVGELRKAVPADRQQEIFGRLAKVFADAAGTTKTKA